MTSDIELDHSQSAEERDSEMETNYMSEPIAVNELCVDIPVTEDVAFQAVRNNDHMTITRRLHEGLEVNMKHTEVEGEKVYMIRDRNRAERAVRLKGYSMLHVAVFHGSLETIQLLLSHGANVNIIDDNRRSPVAAASSVVRPDVVQMLINAGADVNSQSVSGRTPLIEAVTNNSLVLVKLLLEAGADPDLADYKGATPLFTCLGSAGKTGGVDIVQALIQGGCTVDLKNKQGATPLMYTIGFRRLDIAQLLLEAGADINSVDSAGKNVFHLISGTNTALFLLNHGATCDAPDKNGMRPLDRAVEKGLIGLIRLLLGADSQRTVAIMHSPRVVQARQQVPIFDNWLWKELHNPRDLRRLCRQTIRHCLSPSNTAHIISLPIPQLLKDFLLAKHLDLSFS